MSPEDHRTCHLQHQRDRGSLVLYARQGQPAGRPSPEADAGATGKKKEKGRRARALSGRDDRNFSDARRVMTFNDVPRESRLRNARALPPACVTARVIVQCAQAARSAKRRGAAGAAAAACLSG